MNIIRVTTDPGRPEETLRQSEASYDRLVEPAHDTVIEHASGKSPYVKAARAKLHSPSGGSSWQTRSALSRPLSLGDGALFTHFWQEWKGTGTCEETQLW